MSLILDNNETQISLDEAAGCVPRHKRGRKVHTSTVWRWCREGFGPHRIQLEYIKVGARIFTSREALRRFAQACTEADSRQPLPTYTPAKRGPKPQNPGAAARRKAATQRALARHGITY